MGIFGGFGVLIMTIISCAVFHSGAASLDVTRPVFTVYSRVVVRMLIVAEPHRECEDVVSTALHRVLT